MELSREAVAEEHSRSQHQAAAEEFNGTQPAMTVENRHVGPEMFGGGSEATPSQQSSPASNAPTPQNIESDTTGTEQNDEITGATGKKPRWHESQI